MSDPASYDSLTYATPPTGRTPVTAGVWLMLGGLGCIFLGGCFLIGVLIVLMSNNQIPPVERVVFQLILYTCCGLCLTAGGFIGFQGVRKLMSAGRY